MSVKLLPATFVTPGSIGHFIGIQCNTGLFISLFEALIVMVHFVYQPEWATGHTDIQGTQTLFWVFLPGDFWTHPESRVYLVLASVDRVMQIALPIWGGLLQSVEDLNKIKD